MQKSYSSKPLSKLDGNEKDGRKIIKWYMILTARYASNPKPTVWNGSEKLIYVKIDVLKKASVPKLYIAFVDISPNNEKLISSIW